jgi:glycosyltransferase involved in cell wall biosynthesis
MRFSIIIPTHNNCDYLKLCVDSIIKNSSYDHEIIIHINGSDVLTERFVNENKYKFTKTDKNVGLCSGVNKGVSKATTNYIVYAHDDMYFLPLWDYHLINEINSLPDNLFYFSSTQISHIEKDTCIDKINHIQFNAGNNIDNFDEEKLLLNYKNLPFHDMQGSHWAPHIIHKLVWDHIGGFSPEFDPGFASDPDLNMKLWKVGVRIFKGVNLSRVYHFGSLTTRKNLNILRNNGKKTFLLKWKISVDYFIKFYLQRGSVYSGKLIVPKFSLSSFTQLIFCKINYFFKKFL